MSEIIENAVISIQLGIEDYKANDPRRPISAIRNFYAGVLLLGKECLIETAPDADPMEVLASRFAPVPNGTGGVEYEPKGHTTIDLPELRARFRAFELQWPDGDITSLQKLRNQFEHYHSPAPQNAIRQAIADCFPIVAGFFELLSLDPAETLGDAWQTMVQEKAFYSKQKRECNLTLHQLPWFDEKEDYSEVQCPNCASSLLEQDEPENDDPAEVLGKCRACAEEIGAVAFAELVVEGLFGIDAYIAAKEGDLDVIHECTECSNSTYVACGEINQCFYCRHQVEGECSRCGDALGIANQSVNVSALCDYCYHMSSKDD